MTYESPKQAEGINVSDEHPLRDLVVLLAAVTAISFILVLLLAGLAQRLATHIPFETEERIAQALPDILQLDEASSESDNDLSQERASRENFLRELGERLRIAMGVSEPMRLTIHYSDTPTVNAFATLGGQIVIHAGLANKLTNENALAMVLAHEIAHVKLRHPIVAMSRGVTVSIALGTMFGLTDNDGAAQLVQWLGVTTTLSFSRAQEHAADALAAETLIKLYGHLEGADELYQALKLTGAEEIFGGGAGLPEFLNTHPDLDERLQRLDKMKANLGVTGSVTSLAW